MPARIRNGTTENPSGVISRPAMTGTTRGWMKPHVLLWRMASTMIARPLAERAAPTMSRLGGFGSAGADFMRFRRSRITATMKTSPTNTRRHVHVVVTQPPITGPAAIAAAATPPTIP